MNIFDFGVGGIYKIYCKSTRRIYIGQTYSFLFRANQHFTHLNNQTHECTSMQDAGLAERTAQVRQRCKSKSEKWSTWILKDRSNDYPIEE